MTFSRLFPRSTSAWSTAEPVPRVVLSDVREFARGFETRRALCELVGQPSTTPPDHVFDSVVAGLESGRLRFELLTFGGATGSASQTGPDSRELRELAEPVEEIVQRYRLLIELVDESELPVPQVAYRVIDGDGREHRGRLDEAGRAEVLGLRSEAPCKVSFPDLDGEAWDYIYAAPL